MGGGIGCEEEFFDVLGGRRFSQIGEYGIPLSVSIILQNVLRGMRYMVDR